MPYRKPVYNYLSDQYKVTILHSGKRSVGASDKYTEVVVNNYKFIKFNLQPLVLKKILSGKYDAIIVMFDFFWPCNILSVFLKRKTKYYWWGHGFGTSALGNQFRKFLIKFSDGIIVYSEHGEKILLNAGVEESKVFVANNTVEVENHGCDYTEGKKRFLYVGRAQKRKKIDEALKAFSLLPKIKQKKVVFTIIGNGIENERLKNIANILGIADCVEFPGEINDSTLLKKYFQSSFAYVSPGHVGLGVLHSFAYGVPVITKKNGKHAPEYHNIQDGYNSLLYDGTVNDLREKMEMFLRDKNKTYEYGRNAYEHYINNCNMENMVNGFKQAINYACMK